MLRVDIWGTDLLIWNSLSCGRPRGPIEAMLRALTLFGLPHCRARLSRLVEEASSTHERFDITRNGQRVAVLLGAEDYDSLQETLAVLADAELVAEHLAGIDELLRSEGLDADQLAGAMRAAARSSKAE